MVCMGHHATPDPHDGEAEARTVDVLAFESVPSCGKENIAVETGASFTPAGSVDNDEGPIFTGGVATGAWGVCLGVGGVHNRDSGIDNKSRNAVAAALEFPLGDFAKLKTGVSTSDVGDDYKDVGLDGRSFTFNVKLRFDY